MPTRLNKHLSEMGICSRREADRWIQAGDITINGRIAVLGDTISKDDIVLVRGEAIPTENETVYLLLNKPMGITSTTDKTDPSNIVDFVGYKTRIFHVGRLDKDSEGLILLTNDGDIVNRILRTEHNHEKEYVVTVDKPITKDFVKQMAKGVPILDTVTKRCKVIQRNKYTFRIILTEGLNRQIRRMCSHFGYKVTHLKRVRIMHIIDNSLSTGKWRQLTEEERTKLLQATK